MTTFDTKLLKDPEVILRVKRRVGPMSWSMVPVMLSVLAEVLEHLSAPDPMNPEPLPAKRPRKK